MKKQHSDQLQSETSALKKDKEETVSSMKKSHEETTKKMTEENS